MQHINMCSSQYMQTCSTHHLCRVQATQRAGRAGRTAPGKCFRLYTRRYFDMKMPDVTVPEIQRMALVGAVLHLKSLQLGIDVLNFDFLDPPAVRGLWCCVFGVFFGFPGVFCVVQYSQWLG